MVGLKSYVPFTIKSETIAVPTIHNISVTNIYNDINCYFRSKLLRCAADDVGSDMLE